MSHLSKLKIVAQQQKRLQSKTEHRRAKLLEKLGRSTRYGSGADRWRHLLPHPQGLARERR